MKNHKETANVVDPKVTEVAKQVEDAVVTSILDALALAELDSTDVMKKLQEAHQKDKDAKSKHPYLCKSLRVINKTVKAAAMTVGVLATVGVAAGYVAIGRFVQQN